MSCKLVKNKDVNIIPMRYLPGGKLGIIVDGDFAGRIVQKGTCTGDGFIILGYGGNAYSYGHGYDCKIPVRVLEEGELIEIKYSRR